MARDEVNIKVSANVAEAIRMWRAMEQGPEAMAHALDKTGAAGKRAASGMQAEFSKMAGQWVSIAAGINFAKQALDLLIAAQQKYNAIVAASSTQVDTLKRKFANQTGATNQQMEQSKASILNIARNRAVTPETAFATATQLASSGFSREQASGESLDILLKLANATNYAGDGADVAGMAGAVINFLQSTKQPANEGAIEKTARAVHGLFQGTDLQASHLAAFAPKAGVIANATGMTNEQLPILSQFLDMAPSIDVASTAMKASLSSLATAGGKSNKRAALAKLGLKPEDVDFVGEGFLQVQERMVRGFESVPENEARIAAATLFGQEGLLATQAIFNRDAMATTRERMAAVSSGASFRRSHEMIEGGIQARERAAATAQVMGAANANYVSAKAVQDEMFNAQGGTWLGKMIGQGQFWMYNSVMGMSAENALRATLGPGEEQAIQGIMQQAGTRTPADAPRVQVDVRLTDQDAVAIPHKSDVTGLNKVQ